MIHAFDTFYNKDTAKTVCISFENWSDENEKNIIIDESKTPSDYNSGEFFKRELPCILNLIPKIGIQQGDTIIVDGYVSLNNEGKKGLGEHLFYALNQKYPVIGVAKNKFSEKDDNRIELLRGTSLKPLFITAIGVDCKLASLYIKEMNGEYRMPTLLKKVDQFTRI